MRHKMVNLDPTAWETAKEIAKEHGNFSKWVRTQIMHWRNGHEIEYLLDYMDKMSTLLDQVAKGEKEWKQGYGWVDVE